MTDPLFDLNFMGSGGESSSNAALGMQSPFDQFAGLESLGCTGASMFAPLTGGTSASHTTTTQSSEPTGFTHFTSSSLSTGQSTHAQVSSSSSLSQTSSLTDYGTHFSEYSSAGHNQSHTATTNLSSNEAKLQPGIDSVSQSVEQGEDVASTSSAGVTSNIDQATEEAPVIDIVINNVVCSFSTRCHLNLKKVAREGMHVVFKPENGMVSMKIRKPYTTANIWSSGRITATGANSEADAKIAARRYCRILQKMGFRVRFGNYRVVNVLGTCSLPFGIRITHFSRDHKECSYEPELHPGATYVLKDPKATLKIFSTGSITVTAPRVENVQLAIQHIYPLVYEYRMDTAGDEITGRDVAKTQMYLMPGNNTRHSSYKKRKKPARGGGQPRKIRYYVKDSDGEMWSDSTDAELDSEEEEELVIEEEDEDY